MKFIKSFTFILIATLVSCNMPTQNGQSSGDSKGPEEEDPLVEVVEKFEEYCSDCNGTGYQLTSCSSCGGLGYHKHYTSGYRPKKCSYCYGSGKVRCNKCGGYGYYSCQYCDGEGAFRCTVCNGYGIIILDPSRPHLSPKCNLCKGSGYEECTICGGDGRIKCCNNGITTCTKCWGSGCSGQESYSEYQEEECSNCNGFGRLKTDCYNCDGTGKVIVERTVKKRKSEIDDDDYFD